MSFICQFATAIPCSEQCDSFEPVDINILVDSNEICVILNSGQVLTIDAESHTSAGSNLFVEDNVSRSVYLVNREGIIVLDAELQFVTAIPCSEECDSFEPVDINVLVDSNEVCVILNSGQVLTVDAESHTTSLVTVEGDYVAFYDRSFERFAQWELSSNEEGKDALVTVGWGAAETQFQGSAGKVRCM
ncbi:unnamed protein product [Cylicostephanus goldi]|uniref:ELP1 first N-terminal beta-propeller domain-containing protein n=1 Tax=Cylicostephanus goldi TaxID=71465 RepID=A0A3P7N8V5_CYLGO|nr:unnamed protein product [Cylicostephanus goldi]